jgi:hypothetical protein
MKMDDKMDDKNYIYIYTHTHTYIHTYIYIYIYIYMYVYSVKSRAECQGVHYLGVLYKQMIWLEKGRLVRCGKSKRAWNYKIQERGKNKYICRD